MAAETKAAISSAAMAGDLYVSPFSGWEIGMLVKKHKIALTTSPQRWFGFVANHPGITLASLDHDLLIDSSFLPDQPPSDPADRIIVETARRFRLCIITRDRPILDYASAGHVSAMAC
jgi:PIN domain nuclease of toxin-antitoxin system